MDDPGLAIDNGAGIAQRVRTHVENRHCIGPRTSMICAAAQHDVDVAAVAPAAAAAFAERQQRPLPGWQ
jgi:hypothetical protein